MKKNSLWNTKKLEPKIVSKKSSQLFFSTAVFSFLFIGLIGCDDNAKPTPDTNTEYTVTFNANQGMLADGSDRSTVQVAAGGKVTKPADPTRDRFTFIEWQKTDDTAFNFNTETITADITLTAQWEKVQYTVTFDAHKGGTLTSSGTVTVVDGDKLTEPTAPTKVGSTFVGWQKTDGTAFNFNTETITADITLTAQWRVEYFFLTQITNAFSPLRWWMQRATNNAQLPETNRYFTAGTDYKTNKIAVHIDGVTFTIQVNTSSLNSNDAESVSAQTEIPTTTRANEDMPRMLNFSNLFGTDKTADQYAVNEDTLYITQNEELLATMVINNDQKGLFVKAKEAAGLILSSDNDDNPEVTMAEWIAQAQLATGPYEGVSSTSGNLGVGSMLTFHVNGTRDKVDSISFAQSNTGANEISDINDGTIAIHADDPEQHNSIAKWPRLVSSGREVLIDEKISDNDKLRIYFFSSSPGATYLVDIEIISSGGNFKVTYLSARNPGTAASENPAEEVTITYERPADN